MDFAVERRERKGMAPAAFPAWYAALEGTSANSCRSFHLTNLLIGARPGELARTKWGDLDQGDHHRRRRQPQGRQLRSPVPLTREIKEGHQAVVGERGDDDALIWEGCSQASRDDLPATGNDLPPDVSRAVATSVCGIPDDVSAFLMGLHARRHEPKISLSVGCSRPATRLKRRNRKSARAMMQLLHGASEKKRAA